jgi:hypothetical protein
MAIQGKPTKLRKRAVSTKPKDKIAPRSKPGKKVKADSPSSIVSDTVHTFRRLVEEFRYPQGDSRQWPLTNFTFLAGAGFSKSWDPDAPIGTALFDFPGSAMDDVLDTEVLRRQFGVDRDGVDLEAIRQIGYQIDMYERYPDIRSRYADGQNLRTIRAGLRAATVERYGQLAALNYFDLQSLKFPLGKLTPNRQAILGLFNHLRRCGDGSTFFAEGIRTNFVTTNYDFVIETILDNLIGPDDSWLLYTYRGITPSRISGFVNPKQTHAHWLVSQVIKLNGGFEILRDGDGYAFDYSERTVAEIRERPPVIMLPSREQDYSDPYFADIFPKAVRLMRETRVLIIVGYSLPDDDALMRFVIRQFAEDPEDGREKIIIYIDPFLEENTMRDKLNTVFPTMSTYGAPQILAFKGTFVNFAEQYVSLIEAGDFDD